MAASALRRLENRVHRPINEIGPAGGLRSKDCGTNETYHTECQRRPHGSPRAHSLSQDSTVFSFFFAGLNGILGAGRPPDDTTLEG